MVEILLDTLLESLKMLPFLLISYLIIEIIEHKSSEKIKNILSKSGKFGTVVGSLLGLIPQCGFSVTASSLYAGRIITLGTLMSVFIATSDEAIPVLLAHPDQISTLGFVLIVKFILAFFMGMTVDLIIRKMQKKDNEEQIQEIQEHMHGVCSHCHCEDKKIFLPALKHTIQIFIFIFVVSFILHIGIHMIGEENLSKVLMSGTILQPLIAGLIGLIPNCASSVLLTELFISGNISFGAMIAGLSTGAGIGLVVLFKSNHNIKENVKIVGLLYGLGVIGGIIIQFIESVI